MDCSLLALVLVLGQGEDCDAWLAMHGLSHDVDRLIAQAIGTNRAQLGQPVCLPSLGWT